MYAVHLMWRRGEEEKKKDEKKKEDEKKEEEKKSGMDAYAEVYGKQ